MLPLSFVLSTLLPMANLLGSTSSHTQLLLEIYLHLAGDPLSPPDICSGRRAGEDSCCCWFTLPSTPSCDLPVRAGDESPPCRGDACRGLPVRGRESYCCC